LNFKPDILDKISEEQDRFARKKNYESKTKDITKRKTTSFPDSI